MSTELIPQTANWNHWTADQQAAMEFVGLTWTENGPNGLIRKYAPPSVAAAFIQSCNRTGLDPTAKQIYAMQMGGKWSIVVGVDGMRVVAQRSGQYEGQTPVEWTADGVTWLPVWLDSKNHPAAARVGIYRTGFREALYQVVTWAEFGKTVNQWKTMPAHMLGIRAETHALRKAFPNDLSGLYTADDLETDAVDTSDALVVEPSEDWEQLVEDATSKDELIQIMRRAEAAGEVNDQLRTKALTKIGMFTRAEMPEPEAVPA